MQHQRKRNSFFENESSLARHVDQISVLFPSVVEKLNWHLQLYLENETKTIVWISHCENLIQPKNLYKQFLDSICRLNWTALMLIINSWWQFYVGDFIMMIVVIGQQ